jgi:hypothetical protein
MQTTIAGFMSVCFDWNLLAAQIGTLIRGGRVGPARQAATGTAEGSEVRPDNRFRRIDARYRLAHLLYRGAQTADDATALVLTIKLCAGGGPDEVLAFP